MITKFYRKYIPAKIRGKIYKAFLGRLLMIIRNPKEKIVYRIYYSFINPKNEKEILKKNISKNPFPYLWMNEYENKYYSENIDKFNNLPYINHGNKKMYFPYRMISQVGKYYKGLMIEQDLRSAHRYVNSYNELKGKILLDIGCAEALFTLDVIEEVRHVYLFECDESWIFPLEETFKPWKDKITIIRKYVSDFDDEQNITLDTFFIDKEKDNLFLKMDIEGYERKALQGAIGLLERNDISGSICIYHLEDDEYVVGSILSKLNKKIELNEKYFHFNKTFRHAIMRFY